MLNIIDYSDRHLELLGDLHGDFRSLLSAFKANHMCVSVKNRTKKGRAVNKRQTEPIKNTVFLVCGDCGFGFNKHQFYVNELSKIQQILELDNNILLFLRGNHDDPEIFKTFNGGFDFPNIGFVSDYSILKTKDATSLCVGGGTSHDRTWRVKEEARKNRFKKENKKVLWWKDEPVQENADLIKLLEEEKITVDSIITHVITPRFSPISKDEMIEKEWLSEDEALADDMKREFKILNDLYDVLIKAGHNIEWWCHGHLHQAVIFLTPDSKTLVIGLDEHSMRVFNREASATVQAGHISAEMIIKTKKDKIKGRNKKSRAKNSGSTIDIDEFGTATFQFGRQDIEFIEDDDILPLDPAIPLYVDPADNVF